MILFNQPFDGQLANQLNQLLDSGKYRMLNIAVAFAKKGGVQLLKESIQKFRERGGTVNAYIGIDLWGTSSDALVELLPLVDALYVVHVRGNQTFHPKIYQFDNGHEITVVVGSNNLTVGGLWRNFESSAIVTGQSADAGDSLREDCSRYFEQLADLHESCRRIMSMEDIDKLIQDGLIAKESDRSKFVRSNAGNVFPKDVKDHGFGKSVPVPAPKRSKSENTDGSKSVATMLRKSTETVHMSEFAPDFSDRSFWFETRRLTGGSRNQIDLSMKSLVEKGDPSETEFDRHDAGFMCGFVELFGINPRDVSTTMDITIFFQGIDYFGNIIQFPDGEKANGTWRLLFRGASVQGVKLTDAFRRNSGDENFLVGKILQFSRIGDSHYLLDVFPDGMLEAFKKDSIIVAHNGSTATARLFGILR